MIMKTRRSPRRVDLASIMVSPLVRIAPGIGGRKMSGEDFYFTFARETIREHRKFFDELVAIR
jgi:hypothetical protein